MKLSIVIPQYNENEDDILPLLASIDGQIAIDFAELEVCIVNDSSCTQLSSAFLASFRNICPHYIVRSENGGPGLARQTGIDNTSGEYIAFCDADDVLHDVLVLEKVFSAMGNKPDIIRGEWLEERADGTFAQQSLESTWLHAKAFSRDYLTREGIFFLPQFRVHEDSYFCGLAWECASTKALIHAPLYIWRWNKRSITRSGNGTYAARTFDIFLDSALHLLREMKRRGCRNTAVKAMKTAAYIRSSMAAMKMEGNKIAESKFKEIKQFNTNV